MLFLQANDVRRVLLAVQQDDLRPDQLPWPERGSLPPPGLSIPPSPPHPSRQLESPAPWLPWLLQKCLRKATSKQIHQLPPLKKVGLYFQFLPKILLALLVAIPERDVSSEAG